MNGNNYYIHLDKTLCRLRKLKSSSRNRQHLLDKIHESSTPNVHDTNRTSVVMVVHAPLPDPLEELCDYDKITMLTQCKR